MSNTIAKKTVKIKENDLVNLIDNIVALIALGMNMPDAMCNSCLDYLTKDW
jgi:hypothetical protein